MPNVKSAEKRMRTNKIREERNKAARSRLRTAIKKARQAEGEGADAALKQATSLLDRAARKRLISEFSLDLTVPNVATGFRFDIVLRGRMATPMERRK